MSFPKIHEENCIASFFSLLEILQMKSTSYVRLCEIFFLSKTVRNISDNKKNNSVISLFYTEFKVVVKTKMSNTKPRNWYLSMLNVKEMSETGREHTVRHTHKIQMD